jgi:hypothetical protein
MCVSERGLTAGALSGIRGSDSYCRKNSIKYRRHDFGVHLMRLPLEGLVPGMGDQLGDSTRGGRHERHAVAIHYEGGNADGSDDVLRYRAVP